MKRRVLITLLCLLTFICQKSIAQQGVLKFSFQNVPLKTVLESIEQQTNLKFVYSANLVDVNQKVSISSFEETVSNVLKRLFEGKKLII
ncbi:MAG: STN domain-containing protein [Bacteroidales bacterium]